MTVKTDPAPTPIVTCPPRSLPMPLPIDDLLPDLRSALHEHSRLVLHAPPGTGKTTGVPPALLGSPWLDGKRIVMLEPRRLAARAAAAVMGRGVGESVGKTVGYRVRMDTKVSAETRIEVAQGQGIGRRQLGRVRSLGSSRTILRSAAAGSKASDGQKDSE